MLQHAQVCIALCDWLCLAAAPRLCGQFVTGPRLDAQTSPVRRWARLIVAPLRAVSAPPVCAWAETGRGGLPVKVGAHELVDVGAAEAQEPACTAA